MPRGLPLIMGLLALLATIAVICVHIILAVHISKEASVKTISIVSAILELVVLVLLGWLSSSHVVASMRGPSRRCLGIAFGLGIFVCILAAAASAVTLICLSQTAPNMEDQVFGVTQPNFLIGSSVALGLSFACQLIFMVVHFISARADGLDSASSLYTNEGGRRSPTSRVKAIRYSQTFPGMVQTRETTSMEKNQPASIVGKSSVETMGSFRSSMSHAIRPVSSKTRLLSTREKRRPASIDSNAGRGSTEESFDSWDTSSVDAHNRQIVMEASSPPPTKTRLLETIPASPTISRSPSPGSPLDLEPPRAAQRSRSYSPASRRRDSSASTQHRSSSELNIHPLFRSDSPTPPPLATPGTVVLASPNAGQVITHQHSMRSMRSLQRMRSGSLPTTPSPLSRQGSFESASVKKQVDEQGSIAEVEEVDEEQGTRSERMMTPPIPEWILSAGARTSLTGYNSRKLKTEDDELIHGE